jgi:uncharacterized protein
MAGSSLLALIDDIASILDDVSVMTKVAAQKTAGVLGDDLALNAQQVTGVDPKRELPVVWAVAKGSAVNKLILVPMALAISAILPWAVIPLLAIGGLFLCYEGFEKIVHKFMHSKEEEALHHKEHLNALSNTDIDLLEFEKNKIKGAVRTDFILSAEIIVITLGTVASASLTRQVGVLIAISLIMTIGVYGLVACIVKLDDLGLFLISKKNQGLWNSLCHKIGNLILRLAPLLMKTLSILGTAAMFLVGGGILVHAAPFLDKIAHSLGSVLSILFNGLAGLISGAIIVITITLFKKILKRS